VRHFELIDGLYEDFIHSLSAPLSESARALAVTLRLAPERGIPWSKVFSHQVTLAAPALVAEGFPSVDGAQVRAAVVAHMFAVLDAFGTDRIADRQVAASAELLELLRALRNKRDAAILRVPTIPGDETVTYAHADRTTRTAIEREAAILSLGRPVSFEEYEAVSLGKQAVGLPASLALGFAGGADVSRLRTLSALLGGVWLGLQMVDDVIDWEDDAARGGAWAVVLAGAPPSADQVATRRAVLESGVIARMLSRARRHYRSVHRGAKSLRFVQLGEWARERQSSVEKLLEAERMAPGHTRRTFALGAWAAEVLQ
jgi:hypothetical protein